MRHRCFIIASLDLEQALLTFLDFFNASVAISFQYDATACCAFFNCHSPMRWILALDYTLLIPWYFINCRLSWGDSPQFYFLTLRRSPISAETQILRLPRVWYCIDKICIAWFRVFALNRPSWIAAALSFRFGSGICFFMFTYENLGSYCLCNWRLQISHFPDSRSAADTAGGLLLLRDNRACAFTSTVADWDKAISASRKHSLEI